MHFIGFGDLPGPYEDVLSHFIKLKGISEGSFIHWKVTLEGSLLIGVRFVPFVLNPHCQYKRSPDCCLFSHQDAMEMLKSTGYWYTQVKL